MFKEELEQSIGKILVSKGYKKITQGSDYVMFIKRYSEKLAFYVKCRDKRKWNQGISVEMIFTTIGTPDDGLFISGVGIRVQVLTIPDTDNNMLLRAGEKILAMEDSLGGFDAFVLEELNNEYFQTNRLPIYRRGLLIYEIIQEDENLREALRVLMEDVRRLIKTRKERQSYQQSHDFMEQLPDGYFEDKGIRGLTRLDVSTFAEYIYAQCILDI
ncbi:MAG: hypothetical protein NC337_00070 [Roseburia sp.]|nr:hypothetical protein [Roseburia sp.]